MSYTFPEFEQLAYAWGKPTCRGDLRVEAEDFRVDEQLSFVPEGQGDHVFLRISKRQLNTVDVVKRLCRFADVKQVDVGYAGLKDKQALTTQWFSINMTGRDEPDWQKLVDDQLKIAEITRHTKKLKTGSLTGNQFSILIRNLHGDCDELQERLTQIRQQGVPNYFAEQRFGYEGNNLLRARQWFNGEIKVRDRQKKSFYLSAARSWLFNLVVSQRVTQGTWNRLLPGDVAMLAGSRSYFTVEQVDDEIVRRLDERDIFPSSALWGRGELPSQDEVKRLELDAVSQQSELMSGLEGAGLKQERRACMLFPSSFSWSYKKAESQLQLDFFLPRGCYATALLRETVLLNES